MSDLLRGASAARALTERLAAESAALRARGVMPTLAIVRVGERDDDLAYERAARQRAAQCGVAARTVALPGDATQEALLHALTALSGDARVHGILLLRPLPAHLDDAAACAAIAPEKDVDGVTRASMAALYAGEAGFAPCTAAACLALLRHGGVPLDGSRVVVVGRSGVVGRPAALLLLRENATVTVAHSHTRALSEVCREADVLLVAAGRAGLIGAAHVRPGQVVVDVGIHAAPDGSLCGDVRFDEVAPIVGAITPVPGGVGALTTAILCQHVIQAAGGSA
jgi:methylenetetrahydrofolate dehydrogenase (NADP+)/methenyltetrahydrofolate cyclohydrolase